VSAKETVYKACRVARRYPASWFWLFACTALYAGSEGNLPMLAIVLFGQLWIIAHAMHRMWGPPSWDPVTRRGGRHVER
jgi:hypothetical protein